MTSHSSIGRLIKAAQAKHGVTNIELADKLGVCLRRIHDYRSAEDLKWSTVVKICDAIGITVKDL